MFKWFKRIRANAELNRRLDAAEARINARLGYQFWEPTNPWYVRLWHKLIGA